MSMTADTGGPGAAGDLSAERRALEEGALVRRADELGTLVVTGSERQSWLNGLVTCDLAPLKPGGGAYGLSVAKGGKILAEVWIVVATDRIYVGALRDRAELLRETFERYLIMEDAEVADASADHGWILAAGPRSPELVEAGRGVAGVEAARADWTGRGGAAVVAPRGAVDEALGALAAAGGVTTSAEAWDVLRVEQNVPRFGVDFDAENYPQEASLEDRAVSFSKGCYLGQETVFMLQMRGHAKKRLVQIEVEGEDDVPAGAEVTLAEGGAVVGAVTSRARSPRGPGMLALGYVKYKHATQGAALRVAGRAASVVGVRSAPTG